MIVHNCLLDHSGEIYYYKVGHPRSGLSPTPPPAKEIAGVPDGRGGVLPTIKQPLSLGITPSIPEDRALSSFSSSQPPPLLTQRSLGGASRGLPLSRFPSTTYPQRPTPAAFLQGGPRTPATLGGMANATFPLNRPDRQVIEPDNHYEEGLMHNALHTSRPQLPYLDD